MRIRDVRLEGEGEPAKTYKCKCTQCGASTSKGKPLCEAHVESMPYVEALLASRSMRRQLALCGGNRSGGFTEVRTCACGRVFVAEHPGRISCSRRCTSRRAWRKRHGA